jgi:hypothetical protein
MIHGAEDNAMPTADVPARGGKSGGTTSGGWLWSGLFPR